MFKRLTTILPLVFFLIAVFVVHRELQALHADDIRNAIAAVPRMAILIGLGITALNYFILSFYDWLALRYIGQRVPLRKVLLASSISYAISNNTGHALIAGTSVRYRFYTKWGVPGWEVVRLSAFLAVTFIIGLLSLEVVTAILLPIRDQSFISSPNLVRALTAVCTAGLLAYWGAILFVRKPFRIRGAEFRMPGVGTALAQTVISTLDLVVGASILFLFLRANTAIDFPAFLMLYVVAMLLGLASQVPGGLGIFEGAFLYFAGPDLPDADLMGGLIVYRIVYFFVPLAIAGLGLLIYEAKEHWTKFRAGGRGAFRLSRYLLPRLFAPMLALSGATLLFVGATPGLPEDIAWLKTVMPLGVLEVSHLMGSLIGLAMLFLSRGVFLRLDAAYYGCIVLSLLGIVAALLQGLHFGETALLTALLIVFLPTRRYFDRRSSLLTMRFTPVWIFSILAVLAGAAGIGFLNYQHDYSDELWWKFTFHGDAPRFLRATAATSILFVVFGLYRLLGVARPLDIDPPSAADLDRAKDIAAASGDTTGFLALLGDKKILWSEDGNAFIMYAMTRRYWIAMGDPVGDPSSFPALAWRFREESDRNGAKAVFYEVSDFHLPLYLDLGLALLKVGQEARVDTATFSLDGGKKENQRKTRNRFNKQGYALRFLSGAELRRAMPRLRAISEDWLEEKSIEEKGFSLGFFDEDYLRRTLVAVVTKDDEIFAFANLWVLDNKEEASIDLMRYAVDAPAGTMEYLFVELIPMGAAGRLSLVRPRHGATFGP